MIWTFQGHMTSSTRHRPFPIGGPLERSLYLTISEMFSGGCDEMIDMTLNDL